METVETRENTDREIQALGVPEWAVFVMANSRRSTWLTFF
ncbi:hypothetical protein SAMN04487895_1223 [Paenibacillus sophorae]|uniref:Uncharacterized protein n=1 Tax=Paenibacillus sophorae TaxID=1333845 RepID=A0A1H8V7Y6_9BACL|nr:hypothetical protein SAMN04487895_1223 [Paenibacillus sophorae]